MGAMAVYSGSANEVLAQAIAARLELPLGARRLHRFPDGEINLQIEESIRGRDIYVIQSTAPPVNENLMELLVMLDAFHRGSATSVTAIVPYFGYARQEKKTTGREPITAKLVADLLTAAGADRVVSIDLHTPAIQGFFNIGMDHLTAVPLIVDYLRDRIGSDGVVVSPDVGRVKLADHFARVLELPLAIVHKNRIAADRVEARGLVGEVGGRVPIVIDDLISTGGTIAECVKMLIEYGAQPCAYVAATHGLLVGPACERLEIPEIAEVIVTDTVNLPPGRRPRNLRVLSVADLLAETIWRLHRNESISAMFAERAALHPV